MGPFSPLQSPRRALGLPKSFNVELAWKKTKNTKVTIAGPTLQQAIRDHLETLTHDQQCELVGVLWRGSWVD